MAVKKIIKKTIVDVNQDVSILVTLLSFGADDSIEYKDQGTCRDVILRRWGDGVYDRVEHERTARRIRYEISQMDEVDHVLCCAALLEEGNEEEEKEGGGSFNVDSLSTFFSSCAIEVVDFHKVFGELVAPKMFAYDR